MIASDCVRSYSDSRDMAFRLSVAGQYERQDNFPDEGCPRGIKNAPPELLLIPLANLTSAGVGIGIGWFNLQALTDAWFGGADGKQYSLSHLEGLFCQQGCATLPNPIPGNPALHKIALSISVYY
eukprot:552305-Amphidinium_carterae.1